MMSPAEMVRSPWVHTAWLLFRFPISQCRITSLPWNYVTFYKQVLGVLDRLSMVFCFAGIHFTDDNIW